MSQAREQFPLTQVLIVLAVIVGFPLFDFIAENRHHVEIDFMLNWSWRVPLSTALFGSALVGFVLGLMTFYLVGKWVSSLGREPTINDETRHHL